MPLAFITHLKRPRYDKNVVTRAPDKKGSEASDFGVYGNLIASKRVECREDSQKFMRRCLERLRLRTDLCLSRKHANKGDMAGVANILKTDDVPSFR